MLAGAIRGMQKAAFAVSRDILGNSVAYNQTVNELKKRGPDDDVEPIR
jgi:hypothetical protein